MRVRGVVYMRRAIKIDVFTFFYLYTLTNTDEMRIKRLGVRTQAGEV